MSIALFQQLYFKLARLSVLVALLIGVLISFWQINSDYVQQGVIKQAKVDEIFSVFRQSAQQTVHMLDDKFAQEIIQGMRAYPFLYSAALVDDRNNIMSAFQREQHQSSSAAVTQWLMGGYQPYQLELMNERGVTEGQLQLVIDNDFFYQSFYQRSFNVLVYGMVRNLIMVLILAVIFYWYMSRSLNRIAFGISQINAENPAGERIFMPKYHASDELGFIIQSINQFLAGSEQAQTSAKQTKEQLSTIINTMPSLVFATAKSGQFLFTNRLANEFFGINEKPANLFNYFEFQKTYNSVELQRVVAECDQVLTQAITVQNASSTARDIFGKEHYFQLYRLPFSYQDESSVLHIAVDITQRVVAEQQIEKMAYFDSLTGLPNRNLLKDRLDMDIARANREEKIGALMFVDIDNFKLINDTAGHAAGDEVIAKVAQDINNTKRSTDTLARLGGDEFSLIVPSLHVDRDGASKRAMAIAHKMLKTTAQKFQYNQKVFDLSISIGICLYPDDISSYGEILRYADTAMYRAKKQGKNCAVLFEPAMIKEVEDKLALDNDIKRGLSTNEFEIFIQPIMADAGARLHGGEVLIRWYHPSLGLVSPAQFIPAIESMGMSHELTKICFNQCSDVAVKYGVNKLLKRNFRFSINISAQEFHEQTFADSIMGIIQHHRVPAELFDIEITESVALNDVTGAEQKIKQLQAKGFTFALDDFGTGYSSLTYLKRLPVDKLKIDRSFINTIHENRLDQKLVESIVSIAHNFDICVVAEGIENKAQLTWLSQFENMLIQGFYFSKPMPRADFISKLDASES